MGEKAYTYCVLLRNFERPKKKIGAHTTNWQALLFHSPYKISNLPVASVELFP